MVRPNSKLSMTVGELIELLSTLPPNMPILTLDYEDRPMTPEPKVVAMVLDAFGAAILMEPPGPAYAVDVVII